MYTHSTTPHFWPAYCITPKRVGLHPIIYRCGLKPLIFETMKKYVCTACHYVYDPEVGSPETGVPAGTAWEDVPEEWTCPLCGLGKEVFEVEE